MLNEENFMRAGILVKSHGIAGEVQVKMIPELDGREVEPSWLYIMIDGGLVPFEVISARCKGNSLLLKLDSINSEESVRLYLGCSVFIDPAELLPEEKSDDFSLSKFTGYRVTDKVYGELGIIEAIHDIQQNPLMEIEYRGHEILIPLQDDFIVAVRNDKREIDIDAPPGLIELFLE